MLPISGDDVKSKSVWVSLWREKERGGGKNWVFLLPHRKDQKEEEMKAGFAECLKK